MGSRIAVAASTAALIACGDVPRTAVDLQIDVHGATWTDTDRVRVCVDGVAVHEAALGNGRLAMAALAEREVYSVQISRLFDDSADGYAGPVELSSTDPHGAVEWAECTDCTPCTLGAAQPAVSMQTGPTLGIRFIAD